MLATHNAAADLALVGRSPGLLRVLEAIEKVARAPRTTVLVTGESGTGKELVARAIHARSARANGPFVAVNCSQSTPELFASELFGHVPGAFTGALARGHNGLLAAAEGGTLLLDEIGELPLGVQAQLLRVLQERTYRPVGGTKDVPMDVRLVAATHRDLPSLVAAGTFREDLWYRLNVASIRLPSLRERRHDIPDLVQHLLLRIARDHGLESVRIAPAAIERLVEQPWPGNVRELAHALERASIEAAGACIDVVHLDATNAPEPSATNLAEPSATNLAVPSATNPAVPAATNPADAERHEPRFTLEVDELSLAAVERSVIARVLSESDGNRSRAARVLGIHRATLHGKLRAQRTATLAS